MSMKDHILIADDDPDVISTLTYLLETEGYRVSASNSPNEAASKLKNTSFNLLLADLNYSKDTTSGVEGLELVKQIRTLDEQLPIVVMTAWGSIETAVEAIKNGAADFIQKPWENERLLSVISNQIRLQKAERQTKKLTEENQLLRSQLNPEQIRLISQSPAMSELMRQLEQVAQSDANILFTGENGTGKSFLAQQVHKLSGRNDQVLISVNMGSITETLFESEMFGHVRGAFTDARETRIGRFELADNGTLFLDEVGNTPYSQQSKLLRVLEDHHFEKIGSSVTQKSDFRLICATNCDLDAAVKAGEFRKDLFYRINTVTIKIPLLRERLEDILALAEFFLEIQSHKYNKRDITLSEAAKQALINYSWPGNIRELSHVLERATILCSDQEISSQELGISQEANISQPPHRTSTDMSLDEIEKAVIGDRIKQHDGNNGEAAKSLGLTKSAFYRHLKKHGL